MDLPGRALTEDPALRAMIERAAEEGARRALERIGLHDETAAADVRDLRGLLDAWRDVNRTARQTVTRVLTTALLGIIAGGSAVLFWRQQ